MFELKIGKSSSEQKEDKPIGGQCTFVFFKKLLEGLHEIVKQLEMKVTNEGIYIQAMDNMQVSMVDIFLKSSAFESFRCDKNLVLGVPLQFILKVFKSLPVEDNLSVLLSANDEATDLHIVCEDGGKKYSSHLNLIDVGSDEYTFPVVEYPAVISFMSSEFQKVVRTLGAFGDVLKISANEKGFVFQQRSDFGNTEVSFSVKEENENAENNDFMIQVQESVELTIPYKHVSLFSKFGTLGAKITLSMAMGMPVYLTSVMNVGYLRYYIAPRDDE
ncbi:proliferating cell nuclear antigen [Nematocida minor]|uniref:proliferating cell nuclear antigen n=1 Tax=Nematocida minor TaxID=1912983 RepID=UPI00221F31C3|nr:proliferating cell nuclear antigen [Nematocida minor]KAI5191775.1 proliferating cell nuclear antigen [Nematocida minor]